MLGDQVLHVESQGFKGPGDWTVEWRVFYLLDGQITDELAQMNNSSDSIRLVHTMEPFPILENNDLRRLRFAVYDVPQVQVLRLCRQAYLEANPILWATNVFLFRQFYTFKYFVENRNPIQKTLLRNVSIRVSHREVLDWSCGVRTPLIKELRGLRNLELYVDLRILRLGWASSLQYACRRFACLELEKVNVHLATGSALDKNVTMQNVEWATRLTNQIRTPPAVIEQVPRRVKKVDATKASEGSQGEVTKGRCLQGSSEAVCIIVRQGREDRYAEVARRAAKTVKQHCGRVHHCECPDILACEHIKRNKSGHLPSGIREMLTPCGRLHTCECKTPAACKLLRELHAKDAKHAANKAREAKIKAEIEARIKATG